jgi:hypothetical protein
MRRDHVFAENRWKTAVIRNADRRDPTKQQT